MPRGWAHAVVVAVVSLHVRATAMALEPEPVGAEFQVNTFFTSLQLTSAGSVDVEANGDFVVVWSSSNQDGSPSGVFGQRFSSAGAKLGVEFQVNTYTPGTQGSPAVGVDGDGDFVVGWQSYAQDGYGESVFARRFDSSGLALGTEFQVTTFTSGSQSSPVVARDADGDFVVAWVSSGQDGSENGVFARRFSAAGTAQASELQVNTYTNASQTLPAIDLAADGGFIVAWHSFGQDGGNYGIVAQRFSSLGARLGGELLVNTYFTNNQLSPTVGVDAEGNFVVAWSSDTQDGGLAGIFARRFASSGTALGSEMQVNVHTLLNQTDASIGIDPAGDFVVAWRSRDQDGDLYGIFARHFTSSGAPTSGDLPVNSTVAESQLRPAVRSGAGGDFVVVWSSAVGDGDSYGVFGQRFEIPPPVLDVDGNGELTALTDGLLVLRFAFGFTGATLVTGAVDLVDCVRCDAAAIEGYLAAIEAQLDVDSDGETEALTDGLVVVRFLFGFTGATLVTGAVDLVECTTRCDSTTILPYLEGLT